MLPSWSGVFPALTTKFKDDQTLDINAIERHIELQIGAGIDGLVLLGSLGENGTLTFDEKLEVLKSGVSVSNRRLPVLCCVAETTTTGACRFAEKAASLGADGFMVLPGMQYVSDKRETMQHVLSVAAATDRPIMLYNNPVSYRVDITPEMFAELADESKFVAIKESSGDIRRITDITNLTGGRYRIFTGVDDLAMESLLLGAAGWVAGLVCAFPRETVALYHLIRSKKLEEALTVYRWFMPLLHLDVSTKFVQNIKLAEAMTGNGNEVVRAPRLPLAGNERTTVERVISRAIKTRPALPAQ